MTSAGVGHLLGLTVRPGVDTSCVSAGALLCPGDCFRAVGPAGVFLEYAMVRWAAATSTVDEEGKRTMSSEADRQRFERQLADQFPEWACVASSGDGSSQGTGPEFVFACQRAMPAQPVEDEDEARLRFSGSSWDEAFRRTVEGLQPGDQGDPAA